jgi:hypothetical protein
MENRFSTEYNLHSNTLSVIDIVADISKILDAIRLESLNLLRQKSTEKEYSSPETDTIIHLQSMQAELENKMTSLVTFTNLENQLLSKVIYSSTAIPPVSTSKSLREQPEDGGDVDQSEDGVLGTNDGISALSYETHGKDEVQDSSTVEVLDEFFEIVTEQEDQEDTPNPQDSDHGHEDVIQARQIVLEQLKSVLKPRKEAMKTREEEAYRRVYGELPPRSDDEDVTVFASKKKEERQALLQELLLQRQKAEESADIFQDEVASESSSEPDLFSTDFMSRLDKTLQFGTFGTNE